MTGPLNTSALNVFAVVRLKNSESGTKLHVLLQMCVWTAIPASFASHSVK